jgi:hypothetical protein
VNAAHWNPIKLSAKVFGHISQGLYRSPAGAVKELISNSFDAGATTVRIHTGFPRFEMFSCEDDGTGMSKAEFDRLMARGIGTSGKRSEQPPAAQSLSERPTIGRLGIGLLSLAQICTEFDIISHCQDTKQAFEVTIRFPPYTKEEIDRLKTREAEVMVRGGEYRLREIDYDPAQTGLRIYTKHLRESFRKRMTNLDRLGNLKAFKSRGPYESFESFITAIYTDSDISRSLTLASDYDQFVFGLAVIPPLPYLGPGANVLLQVPAIKKHQQRLDSYNFQVIVDNITLRRPLRLPSDRRSSTGDNCDVTGVVTKKFELRDGAHAESIPVKKYDIAVRKSDETFSAYEISYSKKKVAGRPLTFWGYLFQQTGRIYPRDIQGIIVRIKGVAIGPYDPGLMVYPYGEGPRFAMLSGELIVEEGFEDALNIDRDSFNTLDPHYLRMQSYLHGLLHDVVFPETWGEEKTRNRTRRTVAKKKRQKAFLSSVKSNSGRAFTKIEETEKKETEPSTPPVQFSPRTHKVVVNSAHPLLEEPLQRKKHAELVKQISIAFERAIQESTPEKQREVFYRLLGVAFRELP